MNASSLRLLEPSPVIGRSISRALPGVMQLVLSLGAGGTERLVIELSRRLIGRFNLVVCTLDAAGAWAPELEAIGVEVVSLNRRSGFRPSLGYEVAAFARRYGTRIVHCHHYSPFVYGRIAKMLQPGLKVVFTEHGRLDDGPPSTKRRLINPWLARVPGPVYAVSAALRESMIVEGFPMDRIEVVHNGIDPGPAPVPEDRARARHRLGLSDKTPIIGTIARLDPVKDLGMLIRAFAHVRRVVNTDLALVIVGDGPERVPLEDLARRLAVRDGVHVLGHRDDARELLPGFDVYANSSISEGVSLTILEAMAAGRPVVATRVGGTPEVVVDGESGLLVAARRDSEMARALTTLLADSTRRRTMGAAGREVVERGFTLDRMVDHYARVYTRLAS